MEISMEALKEALKNLDDQKAEELEKVKHWIAFHIERSLDLEESDKDFPNDAYSMMPFDYDQPDDIIIFKEDEKSFTVDVN